MARILREMVGGVAYKYHKRYTAPVSGSELLKVLAGDNVFNTCQPIAWDVREIITERGRRSARKRDKSRLSDFGIVCINAHSQG